MAIRHYNLEAMDREGLEAFINTVISERDETAKLAVNLLHRLSVEAKAPYESLLATDFNGAEVEAINVCLNLALAQGWIKKRRHLELVH